MLEIKGFSGYDPLNGYKVNIRMETFYHSFNIKLNTQVLVTIWRPYRLILERQSDNLWGGKVPIGDYKLVRSVVTAPTRRFDLSFTVAF